MAGKKSKKSAPELDVTDAEAMVEAQQASMASGDGAGYVGTMSPEEKADEEDRLHAIVNVAEDDTPTTGAAPSFLSRHPDAVAADEEGDEGEEGAALGQSNSRVGFLSVEHPRARMASALQDRLKGHQPSSFTADELSTHAEKVGLSVDGSGANGTIVKADLVRAMDGLMAQHGAPAAP